MITSAGILSMYPYGACDESLACAGLGQGLEEGLPLLWVQTQGLPLQAQGLRHPPGEVDEGLCRVAPLQGLVAAVQSEGGKRWWWKTGVAQSLFNFLNHPVHISHLSYPKELCTSVFENKKIRARIQDGNSTHISSDLLPKSVPLTSCTVGLLHYRFTQI